MALNDRIADGRDISWIWDADFETLAPRAARVVCSGRAPRSLRCASNTRASASGDSRSSRRSSAASTARSRRTASGPLYALPTYTALLELRDLLAARGHAPPFWE